MGTAEARLGCGPGNIKQKREQHMPRACFGKRYHSFKEESSGQGLSERLAEAGSGGERR